MFCRTILIIATFLLLAAWPGLYAQDSRQIVKIPDMYGYEAAELAKRVKEERDKNIQELIRVVQEAATLRRTIDESRMAEAVSALGRLRANEAVGLLLDTYGIIYGRPVEKEFPVVIDFDRQMALVSIGKSASLESLRRLALESERWADGRVTEKAAMMVRVVRGVEGDEVAKFMFERAIAKETDEKRKRNLEDALKYLNRQIEMDAQDEAREPEPTPNGADNSVPPAAPDVTNIGRPSAASTDAETGTSPERSAEGAVAESAPFPWAIVIVVAIAALSLGAITTFLLTRRKKA